MTNSLKQNISVVIPTKNGGGLFRDVMEGLCRQQFEGTIEILIVDSGSSDGTVDVARNYGAKVLFIKPSEFNHGTTRNFGIQRALSETIVLMTQDAVPANEYLIKSLFMAFDDPNVAGVYARQIPRPEADIITRRNLDAWLTGEMKPRMTSIDDMKQYSALPPMVRYKLCNFDNVCSAVRRSVWQQIHFKKSSFGEDIEWGKDVLEAGWKIAYSPEACVIHSHNRSLWYEYKRTYLCHYRLYELFGLTTVPSFFHALGSAIRGTLCDWRYIVANQKSDAGAMIYQLVRTPALNTLSTFAQYRGASDQRLGIRRTIKGI